MNNTYDITALGELLIDFTQAGISEGGNRLFEQNPGGAVANVLAAMSRQGKRTAFLGAIGQDMHGQFLRRVLETNHIDTAGLVEVPAYTTLAFVALSPTGERSFSFSRDPGADTCLTPAMLQEERIRASRIFHFGSLSLTTEPCRSATLRALEIAREAGCVITYDPNYRASLWESREAAIKGIKSVFPAVDMMKVSEEETELLTGMKDPEDAAMALLTRGLKVVAVTLGKDGAIVATQDGMMRVATIAVPVVDTTGAGDAFWGGFLTAFLDSGKALEDIRVTDAAVYARHGNATAAVCVTRRGGIPAMPTRGDIAR